MGVFEGVTGVAVKPVQGAMEKGVGGFFQGVGKGVVGLVARPTGGLVNFACGLAQAIPVHYCVGQSLKTAIILLSRFVIYRYRTSDWMYLVVIEMMAPRLVFTKGLVGRIRSGNSHEKYSLPPYTKLIPKAFNNIAKV